MVNMTDIFRSLGCANSTSKRLASVAAGALISQTGADQLLVGFGAPRELHWALAGILVDVGCGGANSVVDPIMDTGMAAAAGYLGAMAAQRFLG